MYDHPVSRNYNKSVSCDGCQYCQDVDYLSEDSDDSYFLRGPYRREFNPSEYSIDEFDLYNSYDLSLLFDPDSLELPKPSEVYTWNQRNGSLDDDW